MSDPIEETVRRLRGLKDRIDRLEGQREGEGEINVLRLIRDQSTTNDVVDAKENDRAITDETNTSDTINTRENNRAITDKSNTSDTVATTSGQPANFVWADHSAGTGDKWNFTEWNTHQ